MKLLENFEAHEIAGLNQHGTRFMVLLIDLDNKAERILEVKRRIPVDLRDRVFVLGTLTEPEDLKADLGTYEKIGMAAARDCREGTSSVWEHRLLRHNADELKRLSDRVRPILFQ